MGPVTTRRPCSYCDGTRIFIKFKCVECEGTGEFVKAFHEPVVMHPGVMDGEIVTAQVNEQVRPLVTKGDGTVLVKVTVDKSDIFSREGLDIFSKEDITPEQALNGGKVTFRGLHEKELEVVLPNTGTSSHEIVTVEGAGIRAQYGTGDHHIEIGISFENVTDQQKLRLQNQMAQEFIDTQETSESIDEPDIVIPKIIGRNFK